MNTKTLGNLLNQRKELVQFILIAVLLALGVNVLASILPKMLAINDLQSLLLGVFLVLVGIIYLVVLIVRARTGKTVVNTAVLYDRKSKMIVAPLHYDFAFELSRVLQAVFQENAALKKIWDSNPLASWHIPAKEESEMTSDEQHEENKVQYFSIIKINEDKTENPSRSAQLLIEAAEFVVLEQLSNHLSEYFDHIECGDGIKELSRKDIPHILLENRVLSLLTTPIEERAIFTESGINQAPEEGEIVSIRGSDGSAYERFDLALPTGTTVSRSKDGSLVLDAKRVSLKIKCVYEGFSEVLPMYFEQGYIGMPSRSVDALKLDIEIETNIRLRALFSFTEWRVFKWIDSFPGRISSYADFDEFKSKVGWSTAFTSFHISHAFRKAKKSSAHEAEENG